MRNGSRLAGLGCLLVLCLTFAACKSDPFVGTWKPAASASGDNDHMRIDSFVINKDGTFAIKFKDSARKEITGTYTKAGDKIELTGPGQRGKVEASVGSDGRLGVTEGGGPMVYFTKG
ncbi:MAG TPA: hypothetical protein VGC87_21795 [Pyrinomonadaceae bacterium]|jgi:hypothetical protein